MMLVLIYIENLIMVRFIMLKSKFNVKRNLFGKVFDYSRGKRRLNRVFINNITKRTSYNKTKRGYIKAVLLRQKAHLLELLSSRACLALLLDKQR